ncbi:MAG: tRNA (guanosine(46)-N7)-methyltransferase TrmB, partial [Calditrichaeota bacterium]
MSKNKLAKFAELETFSNVFQNFTPLQPALTSCGRKVDFKGRWSEDYFANSQPLVLELACGKGDYSVNLARQYPEKNFIGVDVKGNRLWTGAKNAMDEELSNVAFVRTRIEQLDLFFGPNEVSEIWITFPDPFPRKSRALKRLTSPRFLNIYRKVCKPGAQIHLKTDAVNLFDYTLEVLEEE